MPEDRKEQDREQLRTLLLAGAESPLGEECSVFLSRQRRRLLFSKATEVFGSEEAALEWFVQPQRLLDHQRPIELLKTQDGEALVADALTRIEHGVYT